jgi:Rhodopirellula transposase DDE domain
MTGESLRTHLACSLEISETALPSRRTLRRVLNRNGYELKRLRKTLPQRKIKQTEAIFENVRSARDRAINDPSILRISIDTKARVKLGAFDRGGKTRDRSDLKASDHDMGGSSTTPCGLLEIESGQLHIDFVSGPCTSDAIADQLERWWEKRRAAYSNVRTLMIHLDNGPEVSSRRTQFMNRLIQWSDRVGLRIELVYYPPYHSKYNSIERCWSCLERHWSGTQLRTIEDALRWASTMTWKGITPIVTAIETQYAKGVKLSKKVFSGLSSRLCRSVGLEKWSLSIEPQEAMSSG